MLIYIKLMYTYYIMINCLNIANYFTITVSHSASVEEIRFQYRKLILEVHPDKIKEGYKDNKYAESLTVYIAI